MHKFSTFLPLSKAYLLKDKSDHQNNPDRFFSFYLRASVRKEFHGIHSKVISLKPINRISVESKIETLKLHT